MAEETAQSQGGTLGKGWQWVKKHPVGSSVALFVGGAVILYLYYSGRSTAPAQSAAQPVDDTSSYLAAQLQSEQLQAQQASQLAQVQAAANAQASQVNGAVAVNTQNDQAAIDIAGLNASSANQIASLEAALGTTQSNNQAATDQLNISTSGQVQLGSINASTQQAQIASQTQLGLGQQQTSVINNLLNDVFAQPSDYQGSFNNPTNTSTNNRISTLIPQVQALPANTQFSQQQVLKLLAG
jgi:hypothetical protein